MSWTANGVQIDLSLTSPDLSTESYSSSEAAFWSTARPTAAKSPNKLRKHQKLPPSSYTSPQLSFYQDDSPSIPEEPVDFTLPCPTPSPRRTSARLRKPRPESSFQLQGINSTPNLTRRSTTNSFLLWPQKTAQSHTPYGESRKSTSESGHNNAYFVPRNQLSAYLKNTSWGPPPAAHSHSELSRLSPILGTPILERPDISLNNMASQSHPVLPQIHPSSPLTLSPSGSPCSTPAPGLPASPVASRTPNVPLSPVTSNKSVPNTDTNDLYASNDVPSSCKPDMSRSKSFSKIARALSFNGILPRQKPSSSPESSPVRSLRRKSTKKPRFRIGSFAEPQAPQSAPPLTPSSTFGRHAMEIIPLVESPVDEVPPFEQPTPPAARPSVLQREAHSGVAARRRWSVAGALMDEGVSDEFIVQEVEKMRALRREWRSSGGGSPARSRNGSFYSESREPSIGFQADELPVLPPDFFEGIEDGESCDEYEDEDSVFGGPARPKSAAPAVESIDVGAPRVPFPSPERVRELAPWTTTRRALLVVRELLNTERSYLASLRMLLASSCHPPPPALMLAYVRELESISEALLDGFKSDMTVWGVAKSFLVVVSGHSADDIERSSGRIVDAEEEDNGGGDGEKVFTKWSAVVGEWFTDSPRHRLLSEGNRKEKPHPDTNKDLPPVPIKKRNKSRKPVFTLSPSATSSMDDLTPAVSPQSVGHEDVSSPTEAPKQNTIHRKEGSRGNGLSKSAKTSSWRRSMPAIATLNMSPLSSPPSPMHAPVATTSSSASVSALVNKLKGKDEDGLLTPGKKVPLMRDLAIMPTQRVVRYVMLYRDLLVHTPASSDVRPLIELAAKASVRVAQKCDRAQDNAAFLYNQQRA